MKNTLFVVLGVALLAVCFTANAETKTNGKDKCLVYGEYCNDQVYSIPDRITKLEAEIAKGENIYSHEELHTLVNKLKETKVDLRILTKPGR